jgi:hypothetical protein
MANYFTKGVVKLILADNEQAQWAAKLLKEVCMQLTNRAEGSPETWGDASLKPIVAPMLDGFETSMPTFNITVVDATVYADNDTSFDGDIAARWVQAVVTQFDIETPAGFTYANTCDRMRPDGFGGGAFVVTQQAIHYIDADAWLSETVANIYAGAATWAQDQCGTGVAHPIAPRTAELCTLPTPQLINQLASDVRCGSLDFWVTEEAGKEAHVINAGSVADQVTYLLTHGWTPDQIKQGSKQE